MPKTVMTLAAMTFVFGAAVVGQGCGSGGGGSDGGGGSTGSAGATGGGGTTGGAGTTGSAGTTGAGGSTGGAGMAGRGGTTGSAGTTGTAGRGGTTGTGGTGAAVTWHCAETAGSQCLCDTAIPYPQSTCLTTFTCCYSATTSPGRQACICENRAAADCTTLVAGTNGATRQNSCPPP